MPVVEHAENSVTPWKSVLPFGFGGARGFCFPAVLRSRLNLKPQSKRPLNLLQDYLACATEFWPVREAYGQLVQSEVKADKAFKPS